MAPGDVFVFAGADGLEVGVMVDAHVLAEASAGVATFRPVASRIAGHGGAVYWLPLDTHAGRILEYSAFRAHLFGRRGRGGWRRLARSIFRRCALTRRTAGQTSGGRFPSVCLVIEAFQAGGVLPGWIDGAAVSPGELVAWRLYADFYYQLAGEPQGLGLFNALRVPETWFEARRAA